MKKRQNYINTSLQKSLLQFFVYLKRRKNIKNVRRMVSHVTNLFKVFDAYCINYLRNLISFYSVWLIRKNYITFNGLFKQSNLKLRYSSTDDGLIFNFSENSITANCFSSNLVLFKSYSSLFDLYKLIMLLNYK